MLKWILAIALSLTFFIAPEASAGVGKAYKIKRLVSQLYEKKTSMDAQRMLPTYGVEVTEYVMPVANDKAADSSVRVAALRVISDVGDASAEEDVVALLGDRDNRVRQEAARTLSFIAVNESSIEPLKELLSDYFPNVRYNAVRALSRLARENETEIFIAALGDYDPRVRAYAVIALGKLKSAEAAPYLAQMVRDYDPEVRMQLTKTLAEIGTQDCLEPLAMLVSDPEVQIRARAVESIEKLNVKGVDDVLVRIADNPDPRVASRAIYALAERKSPQALEVAKANLDAEHMEVKLAAIDAVGKLGKKGDKALLKPLLAAESTLVRKEAKKVLTGTETGK